MRPPSPCQQELLANVAAGLTSPSGYHASTVEACLHRAWVRQDDAGRLHLTPTSPTPSAGHVAAAQAAADKKAWHALRLAKRYFLLLGQGQRGEFLEWAEGES